MCMLIAYMWPCVCGSICMCVCLHVLTVYACVRRDDFVLEKVEQESQARALLDQTISMLQSIAQQNANVVDRMKLMQISRNMVGGLCRSVASRMGFSFLPGSLTGFNKTVSLCLLFVVEVACS